MNGQANVTEIDDALSVAELAAVIQEALECAGLEAVLSVGSVVTIYSDNEYESFDLDFVSSEDLGPLAEVMSSLGFERASGRHFEHPRSRYFVEFPPGPLSVGDQILGDTARLATPAGTIRVLTPTQCVMDRLAAFYHWNDRQGLDQALMVARRHDVDRPTIESSSTRKGHEARFQEFIRRLNESARL